MAPVNTGSSIGTATDQRSLVYSHTTAAGNNQVLYVFISGSSSVFTSATYNSTSMDVIYSSINMSIYRLVNPAVGTYSISFSWTAKSTYTSMSASYKDVEVVLPNLTEAVSSGSGSGSHPTGSITSGVNSIVIDFAFGVRASAAISISADGAGQTRLQSGHQIDISGIEQDFVLTEKAGAASVTMSHTLSPTGSDTNWKEIIYTINPKTAVTQNGFFF